MKVIITGSTGMVGKGVLLECLDSSQVSEILVINRRSVEIDHPKLKEIIHKDFLNLEPIKSEMAGYDAIFHCMGVSAVGLKEPEYTRLTYDLTVHWADTLYELNPAMTFIYVSGQGTDSSEKGRSMWGRVKGRTENMVLAKRFKHAYAFRPGGIIPEKGIKSATPWINTMLILFRPFFPLMRKMKSITTTSKIGLAMINVVLWPIQKSHIDANEINNLATVDLNR